MVDPYTMHFPPRLHSGGHSHPVYIPSPACGSAQPCTALSGPLHTFLPHPHTGNAPATLCQEAMGALSSAANGR